MIRVLSVTSEIFPLVKTGGLADVAGALPGALAAVGVETRSLVPGYPAILEATSEWEIVHHFPELFGGPAWLLAGHAGTLNLFTIDAPHLYDRPGGPYAGSDGRDWPDNAQRFAALGRVAADIGRGLVPGFAPDVVHAHDWQAGLAPAYLHYGGESGPGTVVTVHNLAFQGQFPAGLLPALGLPPESYAIEGVEYYGSIGFLKAGLRLADRITTVSPTYALEIQTDEGGMGLAGLLRTRRGALSGILNGIDESVWNPRTDTLLPAGFDTKNPEARARNKAALQSRLGMTPDPGALLIGAVSRLSWQKGLDVLLTALPALVENGVQVALLGSGERGLEQGFAAAAAQSGGRVGVQIGYHEELAHLIQGGSDALLIPSRFEPCGLTQLCALRYGSLPIVARVGGLSDTVIDANEMALAAGVATGFQFVTGSETMLVAAVARALAVWQDQALWRSLQQNGMAAEVGWRRPAQRYAALYQEVARSGGLA